MEGLVDWSKESQGPGHSIRIHVYMPYPSHTLSCKISLHPPGPAQIYNFYNNTSVPLKVRGTSILLLHQFVKNTTLIVLCWNYLIA